MAPLRERVGNWILNAKPKDPLEIGSTGTVFFAGRLAETDYNSDLWGDRAVTLYDKMRRSDGQVKAALLACTLPLMSARWEVLPGGDDPAEKEVAQRLQDNLFDGMTISFDGWLRQALLMLTFGHMVFEKVWELKDGYWQWRKLAPRMPKSIMEWLVDDTGGLRGIKQGFFRGSTYKQEEIYVPKILVFTHEQEGSDFRGISLLRAAYKHWYYKDNLYRIDGIAAERHGVGVARFKYPANTPQDDKDKISAIGERLHTHERSYVSLPEQYEFDLLGVQGQLHPILESIEHHDTMIVRSVLAQFLNLGSKSTGSYSLSEDHSRFFLMALKSVGKEICETMNRHAIPEWVSYNFAGVRPPKLSVGGLETFNLKDYSRSLKDLVAAGALTADDDVEDSVRQVYKLPPRKQSVTVEDRKPKVPGANEETADKVDDLEDKASLKLREPWAPFRDLRGAGERSVSFSEISEQLDSSEDRLVAAAKAVQDKQIAKFAEAAAQALKDGAYDKLATLEVPYRDQMVRAVLAVLGDVADFGAKQVADEAQRQTTVSMVAVDPSEGSVKAILRARARATAAILSSRLRAAAVWEALRQARLGVSDEAGLVTHLTALSDKQLVTTVQFTTSEAFNLGRSMMARKLAGDIKRVEISALLDDNTCGYCASRDNEVLSLDEFERQQPPFQECEGQDRCRCIGIYVFAGEE